MMWPFRKKHSLADSGIFAGFTDWHSHILPGVDDGVQTMDEALEILALYEELEVKAIWLTPHIMEEMPNTTTYLKERFMELKTAYKGSVRLHLAAEYMLDNLFRERLDTGDLLPLGDKGEMLLTETSCYSPPANLYDLLERIKSEGFYPAVAHPERYMYMNNEEYRRLEKTGVRFQLNLPSLTGLYGETVRNKTEYLLTNGLVDLWGTDCHNFHMAHGTSTRKLRKSILRTLSRPLI